MRFTDKRRAIKGDPSLASDKFDKVQIRIGGMMQDIERWKRSPSPSPVDKLTILINRCNCWQRHSDKADDVGFKAPQK